LVSSELPFAHNLNKAIYKVTSRDIEKTIERDISSDGIS
jgi:hypothetical protein